MTQGQIDSRAQMGTGRVDPLPLSIYILSQPRKEDIRTGELVCVRGRPGAGGGVECTLRNAAIDPINRHKCTEPDSRSGEADQIKRCRNKVTVETETSATVDLNFVSSFLS